MSEVNQLKKKKSLCWLTVLEDMVGWLGYFWAFSEAAYHIRKVWQRKSLTSWHVRSRKSDEEKRIDLGPTVSFKCMPPVT